jgi:hypothetical protein
VSGVPTTPAQPHEGPGVPSGDPVLLRRGNLVVTRTRLLQAGGLLVLLLLGAVLPYLSLAYIDAASEPVTGRPRLFGAARLLGGLDPTYLPGYAPPLRSDYDLALNFAAAGPGLQQIGTVVAALTCWALLTEEINRFAWWFLHLSGYPLVLAPVALLVGDVLLRRLDVPMSLGPGWVPSLLAGVLVLVATWRARPRIDSYSAF